MEGRVLDYIALGILVSVAIIILYAVIYIHDIPYNIAKRRNHPHAHAIHTAGWVSLFLMHALWPFLWIWATLYVPGKGFGMSSTGSNKTEGDVLAKNEATLLALQARVDNLEQKQSPVPLEQKSKAAAKEA